MIIFKKKDENVYLITNYKVMFSALSKQDSLVRVYPNKTLYFLALISWIGPFSKFYFLVRNPFDRIASFYKSKFKKAEQVRIWMRQNEKDSKWQLCTMHFFPFLGLNKKMDPSEVSKKLTATNFEEVINILPHVYMKDKHMIPQYISRKFTFKKFKVLFNIPIKFKKIFKFENEEHLLEIATIFKVDFSIKYNRTDNLNESIVWHDNMKAIISNLYKKDIKYFNY